MDETMKRNNLWCCLVLLSAPMAAAAEYHVSVRGDDAHDGSAQRPLRTIQRAAKIAQPGDTITVHEGVYRERVDPPRGGTSDDRRIVYQAAPGEQVVIKGSEIVTGWMQVEGDVWKAVLPNSFFGGFNPYNDVIGGEWYGTPRDGFDRHTGAVYLDGDWLDEAKTLAQVLPSATEHKGPKDQVLGGKTAAYGETAIAGTDEDPLYQTCRYDLGGYRLAVPNGTHRVTLKFCEPHFDAAAKRVFDVRLQGNTVLTAFDIFAKAGKFTSHDEVFDGIEVTDGQLKIDIINRVSLACISGIVVESGEYSRKVNCGGPAWEAYQGDLVPDQAGAAVTHGRPLWFAQVDTENTTIWAQFKGVDPNVETVEINVRQSVFYPSEPGRNFITVRGFTMRHAATPWSGAMSEQIGLIGTHWSKGWIIEDNVISHSMNTGITLGRYDLGRYNIAMPPVTAPGFVTSCELAIQHGWSEEHIGGHVVRNNRISHCEKNGIHGSLGGVFSTIEGNIIHDIALRGWIGGPDVAGLKLLGSVDTLIKNNHIYRCGGFGGIWLDWMAQGARVTGNLLHDNAWDLFMEVNHGPFLIDHNLLLSGRSLRDWSQGGAYAHNLILGQIEARDEGRETPYFTPNTVADMKLSDIKKADRRFYNNLFAAGNGTAAFNTWASTLQASGNVYLAGANPSDGEGGTVVKPGFNSGVAVTEGPGGEWWFEMAVDPAWLSALARPLVTTELLGTAIVPNAPFVQPDGTPYRLDNDYSGAPRNAANPSPGPFEFTTDSTLRLKVGPLSDP
jgi:alpha-L-arabinofuranosidase